MIVITKTEIHLWPIAATGDSHEPIIRRPYRANQNVVSKKENVCEKVGNDYVHSSDWRTGFRFEANPLAKLHIF